jgi:hypothetical protein
LHNSIVPRLSGVATLCCIHHVVKRQYDQVLYDKFVEKPSECLCCENVFVYDYNVMDAPLLCPKCDVTKKGVMSNGRVV